MGHSTPRNHSLGPAFDSRVGILGVTSHTPASTSSASGGDDEVTQTHTAQHPDEDFRDVVCDRSNYCAATRHAWSERCQTELIAEKPDVAGRKTAVGSAASMQPCTHPRLFGRALWPISVRAI